MLGGGFPVSTDRNSLTHVFKLQGAHGQNTAGTDINRRRNKNNWHFNFKELQGWLARWLDELGQYMKLNIGLEKNIWMQMLYWDSGDQWCLMFVFSNYVLIFHKSTTMFIFINRSKLIFSFNIPLWTSFKHFWLFIIRCFILLPVLFICWLKSF